MRMLILIALMLFVPKVVMAAPTPQAAMESLTKAEKTMTKTMDDTQRDQFNKIRTAHGTLRAIDDVRASLDRAVKSCIGANTELANTMKISFQTWKNDVLPQARRGQNRLDKMILTQSFAKPAAVRAYLKLFDTAIAAQNNTENEVPVKELTACKAMQDNMKKSSATMSELIVETLGLDQEPKAIMGATVPAPAPTSPARGE